MDLGVVAGPDVEAVPGAAGGVLQESGVGALSAGVPGAVLGEGLQGLPVLGAVEADEGLGDGVFLDVERQSGAPDGEAAEAGASEAGGVGIELCLPERSRAGSVHGGTSSGVTGCSSW